MISLPTFGKLKDTSIVRRQFRGPPMMIDPIRWYRRRQRLLREANDEIQFLRRRHGPAALDAAREKLARPDLTHWGRSVVIQAIRELERSRQHA
jgi:hypothetical protein